MSHDALIDALSGYIETDAQGTVRFFNNAGLVHSMVGPAIIYQSGTKIWCRHGLLHRTDGPAVIYADGTRIWFLDGYTKTEEEFNSCIAKGDYLEP